MRRLSEPEAEELARALDLDVYAVGICHACLCIVSFSLEQDDEREIRRTTTEVGRWLWEEGLALPVQAALERARRRGVPGADVALEQVQGSAHPHRTRVVAAIVRRLAADLTERSRGEFTRLGSVVPLRAPEGA